MNPIISNLEPKPPVQPRKVVTGVFVNDLRIRWPRGVIGLFIFALPLCAALAEPRPVAENEFLQFIVPGQKIAMDRFISLTLEAGQRAMLTPTMTTQS